MGSFFVGKVLMSMHDQPAKAVADVELEPIRPGVWAAWARACASEQALKATAPDVSDAPGTGRVPESRTPELVTSARRG
jgi:hypothetical protein